MKLRSLLSLEGIGLESNRSSALTEYGCEQVGGSARFFQIFLWLGGFLHYHLMD